MNKYEIRTQKKKDAIIHAALALFKEKGYTNVSINEIASLSGISTVSIYNYFNNKEGLIAESINILMKKSIQMTLDVLEEKISFKEKLLKAVTICSNTHEQLLGEYFSPEALDDKVLVNLCTENVNKIRTDILMKFVESGKDEGAIDPSISTQTIMEYINAITKMQLSWTTASNFKEKGLELFHLILYGLIGR
ncbi:TetR/AcrR family transcriptional regulator [Cellulosilyticum sp. I15G10I2]|uniref:TetR/AcrR family transcriptional regulator n=1 Tax=Cellulosilyticum sp. I15G10I2 TaxID=1892843 RepID=UPI00085C0B6A|nr:TetR/AcrR family transcriptional regulator [Cellulosilyticum sp. I15G10I2]